MGRMYQREGGNCRSLGCMAWWCNNSLASSPAFPPGRVPHVRPSVHGLKTMGEALPKLSLHDQAVTDGAKAFEKYRFRPMYAQANMGHPSRGEGLA